MEIKAGQIWQLADDESKKCVILTKDSHQVFYQKTDCEYQTKTQIRDFLRRYKLIDIDSDEYKGLFVREIYSNKVRETENKKPTVVVGVRRHKDEQPDLSLSAAIKKFEQGKPDMVNQPPHYKDASGIECKEITCHRKMPFSLGNAIKYLYRAGSKGDLLEDLKKAEWYLRVAYLNDERVPKAVEVRLLEVAAHRKTAAGRALNLIRLHEISAAYQAVKKEIEKLEAGNEG